MSKSRGQVLQAEIGIFSVDGGGPPATVVGRRNTLRRVNPRVWADHIKQR